MDSAKSSTTLRMTRNALAGDAKPDKGWRSLRRLVIGALFVMLNTQSLRAESVSHPLDPLTKEEYVAVTAVLRAEKLVDDSSRYSLLTLKEPVKAKVLRGKHGETLPREAFAIVKKGSDTFEATVDISEGEVVSWKPIPGVQPGVLIEEWTSAQEIVRSNSDWQAAVRKRGITNFEEVVCVPLTVGYFGIAEEEGRRLFRVASFDARKTKNFWARPIEGVTAVVDLEKGEVVKLIDTGVRPIPESPVDLDEGSVGPLRKASGRISIHQPEGPNFTVHGHQVRWQNWHFHLRIDPRLGPVISTVSYNDGGRMRSILYQGSISELFVPYMDPDIGWYFRTYLDAGEYGVGKLAAPLLPGLDAPDNAVFFDAVFADDHGIPYTQERAACLFERYAGDVAWRHYEGVNGQSEVRRKTELVLRFISAIGNYDYILDFVFGLDGSIKVALGSSGVEQVAAVQSRTRADDKLGRDTAYGHMVAEHTVAINHDHFFSFRLDFDVDGPRNSFLKDRLKTVDPGAESPRKSVWIVDPQIAVEEREARLRINIAKPVLWRVINPNVIGPLGYPVSYQLKYKTNAVSLLTPDDFPQQRAGFTDYHLWVTPYHPEERYAGGTYPNQSKGNDGLPTWTKSNRPIENTDIVLWYTLGFHHVARAEDWPVLPTVWHEFELRPFDFFERNPALDLPGNR